jgi:hypothetical protein
MRRFVVFTPRSPPYSTQLTDPLSYDKRRFDRITRQDDRPAILPLLKVPAPTIPYNRRAFILKLITDLLLPELASPLALTLGR